MSIILWGYGDGSNIATWGYAGRFFPTPPPIITPVKGWLVQPHTRDNNFEVIPPSDNWTVRYSSRTFDFSVRPENMDYNVQPQFSDYNWIVTPLIVDNDWRVTPNRSNYYWVVKVGLDMKPIRTSEKDPQMKVFITFDASKILETGETIEPSSPAPVVTSTIDSFMGTVDPTPGAFITGSAAVGTSTVTQAVEAGVDLNDYHLECVFTTSDGRILSIVAIVPVRDN